MSESLKKKSITSIAWKFAERIIAQGVSMVVSIILARLLTPDDYGTVSIVMIFFSLANVIITGGFNTALIQKKDSDKEDYTAVLFLSLVLSFVIYGLLFFTAPAIQMIYQEDGLAMIIRVMGIILPITAVKSVVCSYVSINLQFRKFFFATIGGTLISAVVGIAMANRGYGAWALVAQQMTNTCIDTLILLLVTRMPISNRLDLKRIRPLFGFGWKVLVSSLIDALYSDLNPLFIGIRYSSADLSLYNRGKTFPSTISSTVNSTLSAVLFPVLSTVQEDKERLLRYVRLFIRTSSFFVFPMMLGFAAVADNLIAVLLTEKWMGAAVYIKIFCFSYMFDMIASGNCQAMKAIGRSDVFLIIEIIKKISYFLIIGGFLIFSNSPEMLAVSMVLCTVVSLIVNTFPNRKLIGYSYAMQLKDITGNFAAAVLMAIVVNLMNSLDFNRITLLGLQILCGVCMYVIICFITKNSSLAYVWNMVKRKNTSSEL